MHGPNGLIRMLRLWFGFDQPVSRRAYLVSGLGLALLKYTGDNLLHWYASGRWWTPLEYLDPFRYQRLVELGDVLPWFVLWTLPFLWIGASMTVRRSVNADLHPAVALLFFVPVIHYLLILLLCSMGSSAGWTWEAGRVREMPQRALDVDFLAAAAVAAFVGVATALAATVGAGSYSFPLFVGLPFIQGFAAAWLLERRSQRSRVASALVVQTAVLLTGGMLLAFAIEGLLCIAMAFPLAAVLAWLGGILGRGVAATRRLRATGCCALLVMAPLMVGLSQPPGAPAREVATSLEIDAPPEVVWAFVTAFTELPPPSRFYFRLGIAYPVRAHYVGEGEGAIRYCEFSTGPFIEPITVWDQPNRLAFDVIAQPPTLEEWSPYRAIEPRHVREALRSERGELRLVRLPGDRTRLEGRTWYRLEMFPQPYWTLWSDGLIHRIHQRVLEHVKNLAEADHLAA